MRLSEFSCPAAASPKLFTVPTARQRWRRGFKICTVSKTHCGSSTAASPCAFKCWRRITGRCRSPRISRASGAILIRNSNWNCSADIQDMFGAEVAGRDLKRDSTTKSTKIQQKKRSELEIIRKQKSAEIRRGGSRPALLVRFVEEF